MAGKTKATLVADHVTEMEQWLSDFLAGLPDGDVLDPLARALVDLAARCSVSSLERGSIDSSIEQAFESGASLEQVEEVLALVSGLGVHSLMASAVSLVSQAFDRGLINRDAPLDAERQAVWDRHVGDSAYWDSFEGFVPGFLESLLNLSPSLFVAVIEYCALPWATRSVPAVVKELASAACDVTPGHFFLPGLKLHVANAVKPGAGQNMVREAIEIGMQAPAASLIL